MAIERTLSIIKPDATRRNLTGKINAVFEDAGLRIVAAQMRHLSQSEAEDLARREVHPYPVPADREPARLGPRAARDVGDRVGGDQAAMA